MRPTLTRSPPGSVENLTTKYKHLSACPRGARSGEPLRAKAGPDVAMKVGSR